MARATRLLGSLVSAGVVTIAALVLFFPSERVERSGPFAGDLSDPAAHLAAREAQYPDIVPGTEARIVWAADIGAATDVSVLVLHGFSATSEEIRPVPDLVSEALGANLVFARLRGHGRDGDALADATSGQWVDDTAEALAIARAVGDRVLVIGVSTGATLAAIAATEPDMAEDLAAIVMVSANFQLANSAGRLLDAPGAALWGPLIAGPERRFEAVNADHETYWTTQYPTQAVFSMAAAMREARRRDYAQVEIPLLSIFSPEDQVVSAAAIQSFTDAWGGPVTLAPQTLPDGGVDPYSHVIAGDILSPAMTAPIAGLIEEWAMDALSTR